MSIQSTIKQLIEEIQNAAETMLPIEDLHVKDELSRLAKEIETADDIMLANTVSDRVIVSKLMRGFFETAEMPILLCDPSKVVRYANPAAFAAYCPDGQELLGTNAGNMDVKLSELKEGDRLIGYVSI